MWFLWIHSGSDAGGSTRIPSSFTGCVGLQPTVGRISNDHGVKCAYSVSMTGPMTGKFIFVNITSVLCF